MVARNWLKIDASVLEGDVWGKKFSKVEAYVYLVKSARWQKSESEKNGIKFGTGQLITSFRELADIWGWKRSSVERFCKSLIQRGVIEITSDKKAKSFSCVTIVNMKCDTTVNHKWDTSETPSGTPNGTQQVLEINNLHNIDGTPNGTPNGTQAGHPSCTRVITESELFNNNNKLDNIVEVETPYNPPREKPKGYEKFDFSFVDERFYDVFIRWLDYRRDEKKPKFIFKSQRTLEDCYKTLLEVSHGIPEAADAIIRHCTSSGYQGIFAPSNFWREWDVKKTTEQHKKDPWVANLEKYEPAELEYNERFDAYEIPNKCPECNADWPYNEKNRLDGAKVCNGSTVWRWDATHKVWINLPWEEIQKIINRK